MRKQDRRPSADGRAAGVKAVMPGSAPSVQQLTKTVRPSALKFTVEAKAIFIDTLSATLNVTASAAAAGVARNTPGAHRHRDAAFKAAWQRAIDDAYVRVEADVLDRALNGKRKVTIVKGEPVETIEYSDTLALSLLAHHRRAVAEYRAAMGPPAEAPAAVRERLIRKLNMMAAAMPNRIVEGAPTSERTKAGT